MNEFCVPFQRMGKTGADHIKKMHIMAPESVQTPALGNGQAMQNNRKKKTHTQQNVSFRPSMHILICETKTSMSGSKDNQLTRVHYAVEPSTL